jgi:MinD-like ATPase involved in chromosome partitioning or flagellar assembly
MPRILALHSYRGGTGKSNLSANLAAALAMQGRRVALVDLDIASPGAHVLFGLEPAQLGLTLNDFLWGRCAMAEAAMEVGRRLRGPDGAAALPPDAALFLVPGSMRAADIARIVQEGYQVERLNDGFREIGTALGLDWVVLDTHPGVSESTLLAIAVAEVVFLLLRPDRQDYQGTAVTLDVARRLEVPRLELLVNKVLPATDEAALTGAIEAAFGARVAAMLPLNEELMQLGSSELPVAARPANEVARRVAALAATL